MPDSLPDLEAYRLQSPLEIAQLGDFQRTSVHAASRRCGKPTSACAKDDYPDPAPSAALLKACRQGHPADSSEAVSSISESQVLLSVDCKRVKRSGSSELVRIRELRGR